MDSLVIVNAKRTPVGRLMGGLSKLSATELAEIAARGAMGSEIAPEHIDAVIMGNVLGAGLGMNIARQIGVNLGLPVDRIGITVNMMCASGMCSIFQAAQAIATGEHSVVLCGGTESMTRAPYLLPQARQGYKLGDGSLIDSMVHDGLTDPFSRKHMGLTAETLAREYTISREEQDAFAVQSQQRYVAAQSAGAFENEIVPAGTLSRDEHPRPDTHVQKLATLRPAFTSDGSVTAGNASGVNDGAAILIICKAATAAQNNWTPMARIRAFATMGCDPARMGLGPVHATRKLCNTSDIEIDNFEFIELNEAFAAQALACIQEMKLDPQRVNPHGGAIAVGHPIGATGARLVTHLAHEIASGNVKNGLATLCVGGGMGASIALEAL